MTMYERIKALRMKKGLSQQKLADLTGYHDRSSIAKIESGLVDLPQTKILLFAKALGVTPAALMGLQDKYPEDLKDDFFQGSDDDKLEIWALHGGTPDMADEIIRVKQRKGLPVLTDPENTPMQVTPHERDVILAYRDLQPEARRLIDNALGLAPEAPALPKQKNA